MPYRYTSEQLQHKQSGYTRLFPYCAPHTCTKCTERNTHIHPNTYRCIKKTVIRSRSHWAVHSHKFSNHKTTIFVVLDRYCFFVAFHPLNISLMRLLLLLGWFCSDHHSLQVRFRWYYINISGWHTYIYWALPSSFYNALQTNKKKIGEMLGCFENISSHQRTNNNKKNCWTTPKKSIHIHTFDRPEKRTTFHVPCLKSEKNRSQNTLKFGCETKCKHLRKLCNYQTICGADRKSKELKRGKKPT